MLKTGHARRAAASCSRARRARCGCRWRRRGGRGRARCRGSTRRARAAVSSAPRTIGWPPISRMPAWKDTRVRVDGLLKSSATLRPAQRARGQRLALQRVGAVEDRAQVVGAELGAGEQVARQVRACTARRAGADLEPLPRAGACRRRGGRCSASSPTRWPGGSGTSRCCRRCRRGGRRAGGREFDVRADLAQRAAAGAPVAGRAVARPHQARAAAASNAILVRGGAHRAHAPARALRLWPERRVVHAVRLRRRDVGGQPARAGALRGAGPGRRRAARRRGRARGRATAPRRPRRRLQPAPRRAAAASCTPAGTASTTSSRAGSRPPGAAPVLDHGPLSDHAPVLVAPEASSWVT